MKIKYDQYNSNINCGSIKKIENLCNFKKLAVSKNDYIAFREAQNQNKIAYNQNMRT